MLLEKDSYDVCISVCVKESICDVLMFVRERERNECMVAHVSVRVIEKDGDRVCI